MTETAVDLYGLSLAQSAKNPMQKSIKSRLLLELSNLIVAETKSPQKYALTIDEWALALSVTALWDGVSRSSAQSVVLKEYSPLGTEPLGLL